MPSPGPTVVSPSPAAFAPGPGPRRRRSWPAASLVLIVLGSLVAGPAAAQKAPADDDAAKPAAQRRRVVDRVVAVVGEAIVLQSELRRRALPALADAAQITDPKERARRASKLYGQILDEMINEELMLQAAVEAKIEIEPAEVDAAIDGIKSQNKLDDAGLAAALAQQGMSMSQYKAEVLRPQLLRLRAVNQLVRPRVNVTDEDVRGRYDQMLRRSESVSAVRLAHILIRVGDNPSEQAVAAAKDKAAQAIARVRAGEAFADVAAAMSDDEGTKASAGELGWFERGAISPEWEAVVFTMEKGDVRGPISGPQGLHVFYVPEIKRTEIKPFDDLKAQLKEELLRREMDKQTTTWLTELRKKAYIEIKL
jgi:peptidyl-prolyl cis-trans isomerase SurA